MPLGKLCKDKKAESGLTAAKIADLSEVPENTVINILNGRSLSPSVYNMGPLCRVLGISMDEFFGITVKEMNQHEIDRVLTGYEKHKTELEQVVSAYAQQSGHQDEVIARQDKMVEQLEDRISYQKRAIAWIRTLTLCLAIYAVLVTGILAMILRSMLS